jgi:hypothetical protein
VLELPTLDFEQRRLFGGPTEFLASRWMDHIENRRLNNLPGKQSAVVSCLPTNGVFDTHLLLMNPKRAEHFVHKPHTANGHQAIPHIQVEQLAEVRVETSDIDQALLPKQYCRGLANFVPYTV